MVQRIAAERNAARVGRVEEVLVEGSSRTDPTLARGRTRRNTTVNFAGAAAAGELVDVLIEASTSTTLARPRGVARRCLSATKCTLSARFVSHAYVFPRYDRSGWWAGVPHRA